MEKRKMDRATHPSTVDEVLLTKEAADRLRVCVRTLRRMHERGEAPPRFKVSERLYGYRAGDLNEFLRQEVLARGGLPSDVKIRYISQVKVNPPTFVMFSNKLKKLHFSFERFIENRIRERFPFPGTPIIIRQRTKGTAVKA